MKRARQKSAGRRRARVTSPSRTLVPFEQMQKTLDRSLKDGLSSIRRGRHACTIENAILVPEIGDQATIDVACQVDTGETLVRTAATVTAEITLENRTVHLRPRQIRCIELLPSERHETVIRTVLGNLIRSTNKTHDTRKTMLAEGEIIEITRLCLSTTLFRFVARAPMFVLADDVAGNGHPRIRTSGGCLAIEFPKRPGLAGHLRQLGDRLAGTMKRQGGS